jgi:ureidoglycolate lyase
MPCLLDARKLIMTTTTTLRIEPLDREAFAPFGDVIEISEAVRHFPINDGNTERYHDLAHIDPGPHGKAIVSLFRGQPRMLPLEIVMMERHPQASQAFIPLSGRPWLAVVARPGDAPTAHGLRAFLCQAHQGVNYARGVWHHPLLALEQPSDFLVIDRSGPGDNCDVITLDEGALIPILRSLR